MLVCAIVVAISIVANDHDRYDSASYTKCKNPVNVYDDVLWDVGNHPSGTWVSSTTYAGKPKEA